MCDCINEVNESLKENNTQVFLPLSFSFSSHELSVPKRVYIKTEKINNKIKKGPTNLSGAFCPFCGKLYKKESK